MSDPTDEPSGPDDSEESLERDDGDSPAGDRSPGGGPSSDDEPTSGDRDGDGDHGPSEAPPGPGDLSPGPDDLPTVTCSRCDRTWDLAYELDELRVGNQAVEQFALDHQRHTGHFPDGVATWRATCRNCPERVDRLEEHAARRWAETHARHTDHAVDLHHADGEGVTRVEPP